MQVSAGHGSVLGTSMHCVSNLQSSYQLIDPEPPDFVQLYRGLESLLHKYISPCCNVVYETAQQENRHKIYSFFIATFSTGMNKQILYIFMTWGH